MSPRYRDPMKLPERPRDTLVTPLCTCKTRLHKNASRARARLAHTQPPRHIWMIRTTSRSPDGVPGTTDRTHEQEERADRLAGSGMVGRAGSEPTELQRGYASMGPMVREQRPNSQGERQKDTGRHATDNASSTRARRQKDLTGSRDDGPGCGGEPTALRLRGERPEHGERQ